MCCINLDVYGRPQINIHAYNKYKGLRPILKIYLNIYTKIRSCFVKNKNFSNKYNRTQYDYYQK